MLKTRHQGTFLEGHKRAFLEVQTDRTKRKTRLRKLLTHGLVPVRGTCRLKSSQCPTGIGTPRGTSADTQAAPEAKVY